MRWLILLNVRMIVIILGRLIRLWRNLGDQCVIRWYINKLISFNLMIRSNQEIYILHYSIRAKYTYWLIDWIIIRDRLGNGFILKLRMLLVKLRILSFILLI
jgi:hypothetical protein